MGFRTFSDLFNFIYLVWLGLVHQNVTDMANLPPTGFLVRFVKIYIYIYTHTRTYI